MTLGNHSKAYFGQKKTPTYPPQGVRCQKCLEYGHWSYECKGKRKYVHRSSRTQVLKKKLKTKEETTVNSNEANTNREQSSKENKSSRNNSSSEDSSSDSESSDSSSSDSNSSSSSSSGSSSGSESDTD
ncbi:zinc finger CCHC domain-containing protein 10 [Diabrotica virgifera virgifera]|uniref:Zinc finger CCHC domain-containing protein 10-like n=1 Tax=Diabrotica virgifera virgifera TaxID=50390 RepID=A0A6P7G3K5_DIAVI|nr:zinc finger CCHC domain-containing protein 10 [Diabrotica virgifera virgifera]